MSATATPWLQPGRWIANPVYWSDEALAERKGMPSRIRFIDCTLSEGDDCVGHQLSWNRRLEMIERLDDIGLGEITMPSHVTFAEERDLFRACRRMGIRTPLLAKGPGISPPLRGDWKGIIDHHIDMGCDVLSPIFKWSMEATLTDFAGPLSKTQVIDAIHESVAYIKQQSVRVVPWIVDAMRTDVDTAAQFFGAMAQAGADGVYVVDSRGNSTPIATRIFVRRVRAAVGPDCDVYVQHHNDLGVATANAMAAVEGGANWIDASVLGVGDRGGCVALEEAATLFEMYGIDTGIRLEKLYDLGCFTRDAFGVSLAPWKPLIGANWNKEEGAGHFEGSADAEATIGVAPSVIGRQFESVIGGKMLFGRERSSALTDDPVFIREALAGWGMDVDENVYRRILLRAQAAVAAAHGRNYITLDEFRAICEGAVDG